MPAAFSNRSMRGLASVPIASRNLVSLQRSQLPRYQSTQRRPPSPYRLLQPHAFTVAFTPLYVQGWRLETLKSTEQLLEEDKVDEAIHIEGGDLQGKRLVRVFDMGEGKEGWKKVKQFVGQVGEAVEEQDHHPTIHISPLSDYVPPSAYLLDQSRPKTGYIVELSTHTHTPLPPYPLPTKGTRMNPGVTTKDTNLASKLEEVYGAVVGVDIEVKKE